MEPKGIEPDLWAQIRQLPLPGVEEGQGYIANIFPDANVTLRSNVISIDTQRTVGIDKVILENRTLGLAGDDEETSRIRPLSQETWFQNPVELEDMPIFLAQQEGITSPHVRYSVIARGQDAMTGTRGDDNRLRPLLDASGALPHGDGRQLDRPGARRVLSHGRRAGQTGSGSPVEPTPLLRVHRRRGGAAARCGALPARGRRRGGTLASPRHGAPRPRRVRADGARPAGVPDLVVEFRTESTGRYVLGPKRMVYSRFRVPEFWYVDPLCRRVAVLRSGGEEYGWPPEEHGRDAVLAPHRLPGVRVPVAALVGTRLATRAPAAREDAESWLEV
jgi:hypothetical protein